METILGVFAKQPISGEVKTRLAASIGPEAATTIYEAFLDDVTRTMADVADRRVLGFSPDDAVAEEYFRTLTGGKYELWAQPNLSLGDRMSAFFSSHLTNESSVVLIGSDSPSMPQKLIHMAFTALDADDCVIGPATDGGYYLIGFRRWTDGLFDDIDWGGRSVLLQTVRNLTEAEFSLQLLPLWYDIDTLDDLDCLEGHLAALRASGQLDVAQVTWDTIQRMRDKRGGRDS